MFVPENGDNVITSPVTFLSTASAASLLGANIHFVDVNKITGLMSLSSLKEKLNNFTNQIFLVCHR